jgi:hypothetical protein
MRYPADLAAEWYMESVNAQPDDHKRWTRVFIQIRRPGRDSVCDFGSVDIRDPSFETNYKELVNKARKRVDLLISFTGDGEPPEGICAECGGDASANDFLCETCRKSASAI